MSTDWTGKRQILAQLSSDSFKSGVEIADALSLCRSRIQQQVEALNQFGVDIYSVKGKGYRLASPLQLIDKTALVEGVDNRCFYFDEIDSTNSFMLNHIDELQSGDICIAEYQSAGRGRHGKKWVSPYGHHLYATMFWQFNLPANKLMGMSLVVGCAIVKTLVDMGINNLGLKWPNDVYLDGKKLAGILIELGSNMTDAINMIIGFGVNMSMSQSQGALIDQPWSDLSGEQMPNKTDFMINLHQQLKTHIQQFELQGLAPFLVFWHQYDLFKDKPIKLTLADNQVTGICRGIDAQGCVLLETENGIKSMIGGEISLRAAD